MSKLKYAEVVTKLNPLPVEDQNFQDRVDRLKKTILEDKPSAEILGEMYAALMAEKDHIEKQVLPPLNVKIIALEQLLIRSQQHREEADEDWGKYGAAKHALRLPEGSTISVLPEVAPKVEDREKYRQWCIRNGYEAQLQLWPTTTAAITKERLLSGRPEPDGVQAYFRYVVRLTKKPKEIE